MDWYLDTTDGAAVRALRREAAAYMSRHARPGSDIDAAEIVLQELLSNVARHSSGTAWVTLAWSTVSPILIVRDLGRGIDPSVLEGLPQPLEESGRGLFIVSHLTEKLDIASRAIGGAEVSVRLPLERESEQSFNVERRAVGALPAIEEARPEGGFGRETFLRALLVQLASAVELAQGPGAAEYDLTQVGLDVGGQMEMEFRIAHALVGKLTPDALARCFVRLKHAIDGGFYVVECNEDRIVLGNHRCPFGSVVRQAPALCRVTSSVFGGITARNNEQGASVVLEERIAVGDPGCRVVVWLRPPPEDAEPVAHRYLPMS